MPSIGQHMPTDREKLARELLKMRKVYAPLEARDAEICQILKGDAQVSGGNFQVAVDKLGRVKVSAPHGKAVKGETWELDVAAFIATTKTTRDSLMKRGIVRKVTEYSGAYYGSVTVELF
jgi:hypothetical protein